jgi:putative beta barrel porin BBP7
MQIFSSVPYTTKTSGVGGSIIARTLLFASIVLCLGFCVSIALAAEAPEVDRPAWDPVRPGAEPSGDSTEADREVASSREQRGTESNQASDRPEPLASLRSANRPRTLVDAVSMGSEGEVQVVEGSPEYQIHLGNPGSTYYPPNESLSFEVGTACPPMTPEPREVLWMDMEYLVWWAQGHYVPPLVTTGTAASLGVLRHPDTSILYGSEGLNGGANSGVRLGLGWWLAPEWALEGNVLWLADMKANYSVSSTGDPLLARPFMNVVTGVEDSHIVAFPATVAGNLSISSTSRFQGAELLLRRTIHSRSDCRLDARDRFTGRWDALLGYRFNRLDDDLVVNEMLEAAGPSTIELYDLFETNNDFHGIDMGMNAVFHYNRWSLEMLAKMALGNTRSRAWISGETVTTAGGAVDNDPGGMLALTTNIGSYTKNNMAVIPELGVTLGFDISKRFRATFGYTFIYWSNVARAGSQVDRNLNPTYFPNNGPAAGAAQPEFTFVTSDYWTQGMNFGLEWHF